MRIDELIVGYFSPEVFLPATSIVATIAGIFMMVGRGSCRSAIRFLRRASGRLRGVPSINRPHFRVPETASAEAKVSE
jgi:hypothetical protein